MPVVSYESWLEQESKRGKCKFTFKDKRDNTAPLAQKEQSSEDSEKAGRPLWVLWSKVTSNNSVFIGYLLYSLHRYFCSRAGKPKAKVSRKKAQKKEYMPCGCNANIIITCRVDDPQNVEVKYFWDHNGHTPGSFDDFVSGPLSNEAYRWIQSQAERNLSWGQIKESLRLDRDLIGKVISKKALLVT